MSDFGTESPSGLHCTNWCRSSDHPTSPSLNCQCIGSITSTTLNLLWRVQFTKWVRIAMTHNPTHEFTRTYTRTHTYTTYIHVHTCIHTRVHSQAYVHTYTYLYALNIHIYMQTPKH